MNARPKLDGKALKVPAHLQGYVDVLGIDGAVEFLLAFGGGYAYLSLSPTEDSPVARVIGQDKTAQLARRVGDGSLRVPTGKPFIAAALRAKGEGATAIARRLHVSDVAVRRWVGAMDDGNQLSLFPGD
jgi:hypothetical protein